MKIPMTSQDGLSLTSASDDVAIFSDPRCVFHMLIPGKPVLVLPEDPIWNARIRVKDVPVEICYRLNEIPVTKKPTAIALGLGQAFAYARCAADRLPHVRAASIAHRQLWQVEAAASALYSLAQPDASGVDTEEVLILYQSGQVITILKRFCASAVSGISWRLFQSALSSSIRWNPYADATAQLPLWPDSDYLRSGILPILHARHQAHVQSLRARLRSTTASTLEFIAQLMTLLQGCEAPSLQIAAEDRLRYAQYLLDVCPFPILKETILDALREIRTIHDLRGFAIFLLEVLDCKSDSLAPTVDLQTALAYLTD